MTLFDDLQCNYTLPDYAITNFELLQEEFYDLFFGGHEATQNLLLANEQLNPEEEANAQIGSSKCERVERISSMRGLYIH